MLAAAPSHLAHGLQAPRWQQLPSAAAAGGRLQATSQQAPRLQATSQQRARARERCAVVQAAQRDASQDPQGDDPSTESPQGNGPVTVESLASMINGKLDSIQATLASHTNTLGALQAAQASHTNTLGALQAAQASHSNTLGALAEETTRTKRYLRGQDQHLRSNVVISAGDELLHWCSADGHPASREGLLRALVAHDAFSELLSVVAGMMQGEAGKLGAELPALPSPASAPHVARDWLSEARQTLLAARGKGRGKAAWLPACKELEAYAEAAGHSADEASLVAFLGGKEQGRLVLLLLTALATGGLHEQVEMDGEPTWKVTDDAVELGLLEIKVQPTAIAEAVRQLRAQGNVLLQALAASNGAVLQGRSVHVVGTVSVFAGTLTPAKKEHWQGLHMEVGGKGAAPKAAMQLQIEG